MRSDIKLKIRQHIVDNLLNGDPRGLDDQTNLATSGLLDSVSLLELIMYIEEEFCVKLDHSQINAETFKDINTVAEMVYNARAEIVGN